MAAKRLTPAQEAFCVAYATPDAEGRPRTAKHAYASAYPACTSGRQAEKRGSSLLKELHVQARIAELREKIRKEYVEEKLPYSLLVSKISEGLDAEVVKTATFEGKISDEQSYIDFPTRGRYIELALRLRGDMPAEKRELSGPGGAPIAIGVEPDLSSVSTESLVTILDLLKNGSASSDSDRSPG